MAQIQSDAPSWVRADRAVYLDALLTTFPALQQTLQLRNDDIWLAWSRSLQCEREFPPAIKQKLRPFQEVLLVQALRPDRLQSAMALFSTQLLGIADGGADANLRSIWESEMKPDEPLLIVVSEGVDPSSDLSQLAMGTIGAAKYHEVAMLSLIHI